MKYFLILFWALWLCSCATYIANKEEERSEKDPGHEPILDKTEALIIDAKTAVGLVKVIADEAHKNSLQPLEKIHSGSDDLTCLQAGEHKVCSALDGCICVDIDE